MCAFIWLQFSSFLFSFLGVILFSFLDLGGLFCCCIGFLFVQVDLRGGQLEGLGEGKKMAKMHRSKT